VFGVDSEFSSSITRIGGCTPYRAAEPITEPALPLADPEDSRRRPAEPEEAFRRRTAGVSYKGPVRHWPSDRVAGRVGKGNRTVGSCERTRDCCTFARNCSNTSGNRSHKSRSSRSSRTHISRTSRGHRSGRRRRRTFPNCSHPQHRRPTRRPSTFLRFSRSPPGGESAYFIRHYRYRLFRMRR